MSVFSRLVLTLAATLWLGILPTFAGTPALMIRDAALMAGPGNAYATGGTAVASSAIVVDRCQGHWCSISVGSQSGWIDANDISYGQEARAWSSGPHFNVKSGGGEVCFFSGANYAGSQFCQPSGGVIGDLSLLGRDNAIASVKISGNASVLLCRDRFLQSYCELIASDKAQLAKLLSRNVSSLHVY